MTAFKPKNLDETIKDAVGSALNDNSTFYEDEMGRCFDDVENEILKNLKDNKYIDIKFKEN